MKVPGIYSLGLSRRQRRNPDIQGVQRNRTVGECLFPYNILDIKDCLQFISWTKYFSQIYFALKSILLLNDCHVIFLILLCIKLWRHLKLLTNYHVSWNTQYIEYKYMSNDNVFLFFKLIFNFIKYTTGFHVLALTVQIVMLLIIKILI